MKKFMLAYLLFLSIPFYAQKSNRILLSDLINSLQEKHSVVFSFNPELIKDIKVDKFDDKDLSNSLEILNTNSAFNFEQANNKNILVSSKKGETNLLIKGNVKEDGGSSLPGAIIYVANQTVSTSSDQNGNFKLFCNYNTTDSLTIKYIGFKPIKMALSDYNNSGKINFDLEEDLVGLNEFKLVAYTTSGVNYNPKDQSIEIKPDNAGLLPGESETDIFNSLQYLPGINSPTGKAGNLTMRGTDPDKTLITFDDIPIYHTGHYLGTFSPYNTQVVDQVKIQRNGSQGADKGGRVGGLVEIKSKSNILDTAKYSVGMSTAYVSGDIQVPIVKDKLAILIGGRHSYPYDWNSPKIGAINDFIYQISTLDASFNGIDDFNLIDYNFIFNDVNAKLIYQPHKNHQVSVSFLRIDNQLKYNTEFLPRSIDIKDSVSLINWGVNLAIINKWSDKLTSTTSLTNSFYHQDLSSTDRNMNDDLLLYRTTYRNETKDIILKTNLNIQLQGKKSFDVGLEYDNHNLNYNYFDYTAQQTLPPPPGPPSPPTIIPASTIEVYTPQNGSLYTGYLNYNILNFDKLMTLTAGIRGTYYDLTEKVYPEPRILANLFITKNLTLKTNLGLYNQFINHIVGARVSPIGGIETPFWQLSNNSDIKVVSGKQVMLGSIYSKNGFVFDVEGYYKTIDDLTAYNFVDDDVNKPFVYGNYENYGVDVLVKKTYRNFESWMSYSFGQSNAKFDTISFPYLWNQTHVFSTVASYKWKKLKLSVGWNYKTGLVVADGIRLPYLIGKRVTAYGNTQSNTNNTPPTFVDGSVEELTGHFPNSHQLDVSMSYSIMPASKKWRITLGGGIQNVYDYRVPFAQVRTPVGPGEVIRTYKYTLGFTPSFMLRFSW